jgi:hypothetical protein
MASAGSNAASFTGTISQLFSQLGLTQWWQTNRVTQFFGQNGEAGTDFGLGQFGVNVGSLTAGKVVYVGNGGYQGSSIGQIVQVLTPSNMLVHYQHLMTSNVQVGQQVLPGTVIGTGGGCPVGSYPNPLSSSQGCTRYDQYSSGQHIEVRVSNSYNPSGGVWSQNWVNPLSTFGQLAGQTVSQSLSGLQNIGTTTGGQQTTGGSSSGGACDIPIFGGIICSSFFEQGVFVLVGLLLALVALVIIAMPDIKKATEKAVP